MVAYTIFPIQPTGVAHSFRAAELENDAAAAAEAIRFLDENPDATQVTVWRDDQMIFSGLSRPCAGWLSGGAERGPQCPALSAPGMPCPATCARKAPDRQAERANASHWTSVRWQA